MTELSTPKISPDAQGFATIQQNAFGHFVLNVYEAVVSVMDAMERLYPPEGDAAPPVTERLPFLRQYADEIARIVPLHSDWSSLRRWWRRELDAWEAKATDVHLPLRDMCAGTGLGRSARLAFILAGLPEEDSRFGTLFATLQAPLPGRRPTAEVIGKISGMDDPAAAAGGWATIEALARAGYLRAEETERARSEWTLAVPAVVWNAARGAAPPADGDDGLRHLPASSFDPIDALDAPQDIRTRLDRLTQMMPQDGLRVLVLRGQPGCDAERVAGAIACVLGRDLLSVPCQTAKAAPQLPVAPVAILRRGIPFLTFDLGPGETVPLPPLPGCRGLVIVSLGHEGAVRPPDGADLISLALPVPPPDLRRALWQRLLPESEARDLDAIAARFRIGSGHIRSAAPIARNEAALDGRDRVTADDVRAAARALGREALETHAVLMPETGAGWDGLICGTTTADKLSELERRCHHRETLPGRLGRGFEGNSGHGVRALFTGSSGTGKTYACRILAAAIGRDLYRVDLASVINKYIGETEKNLHEVLAYAEALDVVLLLDEGDSLLGRRTEVKSSNDRYANLETNYLLQRLESYEGILIATTNLGDAIDNAFQRRMDVVVPFQSPSAEERRRILTLHLPYDHAISPDMLDRVAGSCQMTGAQVRNTVQHAGLIALDAGDGPIADAHLLTALASEYRKSGSVFPLAGQTVAPRHGGLDGFLSSFRGG